MLHSLAEFVVSGFGLFRDFIRLSSRHRRQSTNLPRIITTYVKCESQPLNFLPMTDEGEVIYVIFLKNV